MHSNYDLLVIGAGPGGLAAAVCAATHGLSVILINEQDHLGGQIYHSIEHMSEDTKNLLGRDFKYGSRLVDAFKASGAGYSPMTSVVSIDPDRSVVCLKDEKAFEIRAEQVIISAGAMERPVPIPGWTLPGVMGAASVDVLLKQSDVIPSGRVVFSGSGPLMLSVACHMIDCGVDIAAILDTSRLKNILSAVPHGLGALSNPGLLLKGLSMLKKIRAAKIPVIRDAANIRAIGEDRLTSVTFTRKGKGRPQKLKTDLLLLHEGLIPNTQLSRVTGCHHEWDASHQYWQPVTDKWGQSSVEGIGLVGDGSGISGARATEYSGCIAGLHAACKAGKLTRSQRDDAARVHFRALKKANRIRPFIDALYPPNMEMILPKDPSTIICRCEEVRLSTILKSIANGFHDPTTVKNNTRSGMGRCQGRMCGTIITQILADRLSKAPEEIGYFRIRSMIRPLTLSHLADMEQQKGN